MTFSYRRCEMVNLDGIKLAQTNCYLLKTKEGYLLIDCGNQVNRQVFLASIRKQNIALTDIHYLFLTHHHNDHCGLLPFLIAANPDITVIMSKTCADYLKTGHHFPSIHEHYANPGLHLLIGLFARFNKHFSERFTPYSSRPQDRLIEGDNDTLLPELGINGKILYTPGHTLDSISLVTEQIAFVGDAARNLLNFTGTPYQPILLYDLEACYRSWDKLLQEGVKTIYPAHGKPFRADKLFSKRLG